MKRSGYHIFLAVPTRGQIAYQTVTALEAARDRTPGLRPILYQHGNLSVALTRNRIVKKFLETDCTVLAMVDDDIAPPANFLELLDPLLTEFAMASIPHSMPHPEEPEKIILSVFRREGIGYRAFVPDPGANECEVVATGCVAIRRDVLEQLSPAPFRIENDPDADSQSDDFLFCEDLAENGHRVGCWWDGRDVDHFRTVALSPLMQATLERSLT